MCEVVLGRFVSCLDLFMVAVHFKGCFRLFHAAKILRWFPVALVSCLFFFCIFWKPFWCYTEF